MFLLGVDCIHLNYDYVYAAKWSSKPALKVLDPNIENCRLRYIWARQRKTWVSPFSKISVAVFRPAIKNIKKNPKNARL